MVVLSKFANQSKQYMKTHTRTYNARTSIDWGHDDNITYCTITKDLLCLFLQIVFAEYSVDYRSSNVTGLNHRRCKMLRAIGLNVRSVVNTDSVRRLASVAATTKKNNLNNKPFPTSADVVIIGNFVLCDFRITILEGAGYFFRWRIDWMPYALLSGQTWH